MEHPVKRLRPVRSFVRRESRMTDAQARDLAQLWPRYGIDLAGATLDLDVRFGRRAPVTLEIGFGNGEALLAAAQANPARDYLGVEVHRPGVAQLLRAANAGGVSNLRVLCADANDVLAHLPDGALDEVLLFFPDPWPKARHHKRRIVQPAFVQAVRRTLAVGGVFRLATDWEHYAQHMLSVLSSAEGFENLSADGTYVERPEARALTKFERRGQRLGHVVRDLAFRRIA